MKLIKWNEEKWYVPDCDTHWERIHKQAKHPFIYHYQWDVIKEAYKHVKNFGTAIDCGANVGTHTKKFAEKFTRVVSYEPASDCYFCLKANCEHLKNVVLKNMAVGDYEGMCTFPSGNSKTNTGERQIIPSLKGEVQITKLDYDHDIKNYTINLIKLDIQGFEIFAIQGAEKIIKANKPVIICEVEEEEKLPINYGEPINAINQLIKWGYKKVAQIRRDYIMVCR